MFINNATFGMMKNRIIFLLCASILLLSSCSNDAVAKKYDAMISEEESMKELSIQEQIAISPDIKWTLNDFSKIDLYGSRKVLYETMGYPNFKGSGRAIDIYYLKDGSKITFEYISESSYIFLSVNHELSSFIFIQEILDEDLLEQLHLLNRNSTLMISDIVKNDLQILSLHSLIEIIGNPDLIFKENNYYILYDNSYINICADSNGMIEKLILIDTNGRQFIYEVRQT